MTPRRVSPMERDIESRLVATLEAVGAPLNRRSIFTHVDDDFVSEEELALCLGRMVADGRLVRAMRPRLGKDPEAIYSVPMNWHRRSRRGNRMAARPCRRLHNRNPRSLSWRKRRRRTSSS
jgi:hypothetical protein